MCNWICIRISRRVFDIDNTRFKRPQMILLLFVVSLFFCFYYYYYYYYFFFFCLLFCLRRGSALCSRSIVIKPLPGAFRGLYVFRDCDYSWVSPQNLAYQEAE